MRWDAWKTKNLDETLVNQAKIKETLNCLIRITSCASVWAAINKMKAPKHLEYKGNISSLKSLLKRK